ncbi:hypothetical protein DMS64_22870 [Klebsiella variicola]|uniref:Uncharacterized protein n=1 Tax=Klebsiella variicola TaxID=244366 RepID=A0A2G4ZPA2_KLEVA|nr:hypothetical protein CAY66_04100 [Klebsiella variicola]PKJ61962.1 hypothetical protein CW266_26235 [Klebsiella sp. T11]MBQ5059062.1 hypothetical protein [Klebsiella variicola]MBX4610512.1 hypothetical protein [Klebsiella variicola]MBZ6535629.1 hypothetical protein [Klebsiella variicola]
MNQKGDLALKATYEYAMGQINSSLSGSSGVIFLSSRSPFLPGAHNGCTQNLRYPVAQRLATLQAVDV